MSPNDFVFIRTIGTGASGRVILSVLKERLDTPTFFAVKRIAKAGLKHPKSLQRMTREFNALRALTNERVARLFASFHTTRYLFLVLEYCAGGELFSVLRSRQRLAKEEALFYAVQIAAALDYVHASGYVYRDLKPENVLLDVRGYVKLTDFGFATSIHVVSYTVCGTPEYVAPEILLQYGYGVEVDWWAYGVLVYEMLVGTLPFYSENLAELYASIVACEYILPYWLDDASVYLVRSLLEPNPRLRLGAEDVLDLKSHPFFEGVDWENPAGLEPVFVPRCGVAGDASNFAMYPECHAESPVVEDRTNAFGIFDWVAEDFNDFLNEFDV